MRYRIAATLAIAALSSSLTGCGSNVRQDHQRSSRSHDAAAQSADPQINGTTVTDSSTTSSPTTSTTSPIPEPSPTWYRPALGTTWQMQYTDTIDTTVPAQLYFVDTFFTPQATIDTLKAQGRKVFCYIDGGSWETYAPDAADFPASVIGKGVAGWPDEKFIDIRQTSILWPIMLKRIALAQDKGCDGFYHDWAHTFTEDTGFPLTAEDQLKWNRLFVAEGHKRNMSVGLINDLLQVKELAKEYDWAVIESCTVYNECHYEQPFIDQGKPVFAIEYQGDTAAVCAQLNSYKFEGQFKRVLLDAWRTTCK